MALSLPKMEASGRCVSPFLQFWYTNNINFTKMQLPLTTHIAGQKKVSDWLLVRNDLDDFTNTILWTAVFNDYFQTRLKDRYLGPINSIKKNDSYGGEGFSIMTIICSLVEFLETTYKGLNYRYVKKGEPPLGQFEYSISGQIFLDFLTLREPFRNHFDALLADGFYSSVRCGLLHEARTNGKWTIWGKSSTQLLIETTLTETIVYRDDFYNALLDFVNNHYRVDLLASDDLKRAFLRKFDKLCEE
jgi:hypothetical protein